MGLDGLEMGWGWVGREWLDKNRGMNMKMLKNPWFNK